MSVKQRKRGYRMTTGDDPTPLPRLATVANTAKVFAEAGQTQWAIRAHIRAQDQNGLAASGAIHRRGRQVLIDLHRYAAWLKGTTQ
jgi:hypothetical protein